MKILLTGYRGFIGQNVLNHLKNTDHEISVFEWGDEYPSIIDQDWVLHIGAISSTTERDVDKVMRQNYDFSVQLFDDCKRFGVNLQYSSSASVYGLGTDFSETAQADPKNAYAWSKYLFERYHSQHQGGNIVQGFRYFNVFGPHEDHKGSQASPYHQFGKQAKELGEILVFENSHEYRRDFVPVEQVVATHMAFLNSKESGIFNIGTGSTKSFLQVAESFRVPIKTIPMPDQLKQSYQAYTCADMTKTNKIYDYSKSVN
jgi:ADP-L-glycero-D-manno-heptose 6-epimerase